MKREIRYLVVKYADMLRYLPEPHQRELIELIKRIEYGREKDGRCRSIECVVVEHDWPEYEIVWDMIAARVDGTQTKAQALLAEKDADIARLQSAWESSFNQAIQNGEQLRASNEALKKANSQTEHFEREWYLQRDKNEAINEVLVAAEAQIQYLQAEIIITIEHFGGDASELKLTDNLTALRQHDKDLLDGGGWLPIDTAPREGQWFLAFVPIKHHRLVMAMCGKEGILLNENLQPMAFPATEWHPLPAKSDACMAAELRAEG